MYHAKSKHLQWDCCLKCNDGINLSEIVRKQSLKIFIEKIGDKSRNLVVAQNRTNRLERTLTFINQHPTICWHQQVEFAFNMCKNENYWLESAPWKDKMLWAGYWRWVLTWVPSRMLEHAVQHSGRLESGIASLSFPPLLPPCPCRRASCKSSVVASHRSGYLLRHYPLETSSQAAANWDVMSCTKPVRILLWVFTHKAAQCPVRITFTDFVGNGSAISRMRQDTRRYAWGVWREFLCWRKSLSRQAAWLTAALPQALTSSPGERTSKFALIVLVTRMEIQSPFCVPLIEYPHDLHRNV